MKPHITVEDLLVLEAPQILTLSNHDLIHTMWEEWDTIEKVENKISIFKNDGYKHTSLVKTSQKCNIANMIAFLDQKGKIKMEKDLAVWVVQFEINDVKDEFVHKELCDSLWEAITFYFTHK